MEKNRSRWIKGRDLRIIDQNHYVIEVRKWKFNKRNINRIAADYDAEVLRFEPGIKDAALKDSRGRLLWVVSEYLSE